MTTMFGMAPAASAAAALIFLLSTPASANAEFDGYWSVQILSESSECGAGTIAIQVTEGQVVLVGLDAEGEVRSDGRLRAQIKTGADTVTASGALRGTNGSGVWSSASCGGKWTARRG